MTGAKLTKAERQAQAIRDLKTDGGHVLHTFIDSTALRALRRAQRHSGITQRAVVEAALIAYAQHLPQRATLTTRGRAAPANPGPKPRAHIDTEDDMP